MQNRLVVLTGCTGALGKALVERVLETSPDLRVVLLTRADSQLHALARLRQLGLADEHVRRVTARRADLDTPALGMRPEHIGELRRRTTHILHAAATTQFTLPLAEARRSNVDTTGRMVDFALSCANLTRFGYVSTAFVAGKRTGTIYESEFEHDRGFLNTYEQSKYEAEALVRRQGSDLNAVILRPSLILTHGHYGSAGPRSALARAISLAVRGLLPILPGNPGSRLDIIGSDYATRAIVRILLKDKIEHSCYQITGAQESPTVKQILDMIEEASGKHLSIEFIGGEDPLDAAWTQITRTRPELAPIYQRLSTSLPELAYPKNFDNRNVQQELGDDLVLGDVRNEIKRLLQKDNRIGDLRRSRPAAKQSHHDAGVNRPIQ